MHGMDANDNNGLLTMITPVFKAYEKGNGLHIVHADAFRAYIKQFNGKTFELIARKPRKGRTNQQNNYYWGVVLALIYEHTGHSPEELHEAFKLKFLTKHADKGLEFVQSTTDLTTTGMMEYVENVRRFASVELGIVIPDPNTVETELEANQ